MEELRRSSGGSGTSESGKIDFPKPDLEFGDSITVTAGRQVFNPAKYCSFEVGPVSVTTSVRQGETAGAAYARASVAAQTMLESEYQIAKATMAKRLEENDR